MRHGVFSRAELNRFHKCEDFLWAVRCNLHFITGRADDRLGFDNQREIAALLGYQTHPGLEPVERFMKHYFLVAKEVGDLTRIFCASLEARHLKEPRSFRRIIGRLLPRGRTKAMGRWFRIDRVTT